MAMLLLLWAEAVRKGFLADLELDKLSSAIFLFLPEAPPRDGLWVASGERVGVDSLEPKTRALSDLILRVWDGGRKSVGVTWRVSAIGHLPGEDVVSKLDLRLASYYGSRMLCRCTTDSM